MKKILNLATMRIGYALWIFSTLNQMMKGEIA